MGGALQPDCSLISEDKEKKGYKQMTQIIMGQTDDKGRSVSWSSVKLTKALERDIFCGKYYQP